MSVKASAGAPADRFVAAVIARSRDYTLAIACYVHVRSHKPTQIRGLHRGLVLWERTRAIPSPHIIEVLRCAAEADPVPGSTLPASAGQQHDLSDPWCARWRDCDRHAAGCRLLGSIHIRIVADCTYQSLTNGAIGVVWNALGDSYPGFGAFANVQFARKSPTTLATRSRRLWYLATWRRSVFPAPPGAPARHEPPAPPGRDAWPAESVRRRRLAAGRH